MVGFATGSGLLGAVAVHAGLDIVSLDHAPCLVATDVRPRQPAGLNGFANRYGQHPPLDASYGTLHYSTRHSFTKRTLPVS